MEKNTDAATSPAEKTEDVNVVCTSGKVHKWGKWEVTDKLNCTNWGTVSIVQKRSCVMCGYTQIEKQSV